MADGPKEIRDFTTRNTRGNVFGRLQYFSVSRWESIVDVNLYT